ncbi:MAG: hypothetical protein AB2733_04020 [Candidatus Thiodiazotropha taylori]
METKTTRKDIFLSCFDFKYREKIIQHCTTLNNISEDIVLFLARKAACFYRSLELLDLVQIRGKVIVTDRVLGMDCSWMKGKSVAIVDEIVISGTTMYDAMQRVIDAGGIPKCYTLFVNSERYNESAVPLNPDTIPVMELDARAVSSSMVDALAVLPRPYSVDYPLFKATPMLKRDVNQLWSTVGWTCTNNTTELQRRSNVYVLTLMPSERILTHFKNEIGLSAPGDLYKIRIYGQVSAKGRNRIRTLPIVALDPLYRKDIDLLFRNLVQGIIGDEAAFSSFSSIKSRLRLIHYYIAYRFAQFWKSQIDICLSKSLSLEDDVNELLLLFSPGMVNTVRDIIVRSGGIFGGLHVDQPKAEILPAPVASLEADTMEEMQYNLTKPFSGIYREKEEHAQDQYKQHGENIHKALDLAKESKRLKVGYAIPQLKKLIKDTCKIADPSSLLSHFFDVNIDSGIVVPVTTKIENKRNHDLDILFRAYRYGEEAHKGERNIKLANTMLNELGNHLKDTDFQNINTEKFLVLFLIMGQKFLEPPKDSAQVISVKYDQFGAVVKTGNEEFIAQQEDDSFAKILDDVKVLEPTEVLEDGVAKKGYKLRQEKVFSTKALQKEKNWPHAEHLGSLLGGIFGDDSAASVETWKNDKNCRKARLNILKEKTDALTLLASCSDIRRTALALSAEVGIFIKSWRRHSHIYKLNSFDGIEALEELRTKKTFRSVNSAQWKFRKHLQDIPYDLKRDIRDCLKKHPQYIWDTMWEDSEVIPDERKDSRINKIIGQAGEWCLNAFALYRLWEFWSFYVNSPEHLRKECISNIDKSRTYFQRSDSEFWYPAEWNHTHYKSPTYEHPESYISNKRKQITNLIDGMLKSGNRIIHEAQGIIANSGRYQDVFIYSYSLTINFLEGIDEFKPEMLITDVANEIKNRMKSDSTPKNLRHIFDRQGIQQSKNQFNVQKINDEEWIVYDVGPGSAFWLAYSAYLFTSASDLVHCTLSLGAPNDVAPFVRLGSSSVTNDFYLDFLSDVKQDLHHYNVTILAKNEALLKLAKDIITTSYRGTITSHFKDTIRQTPDGKPLDKLIREGLALPSNTFIKESHNMKKIGLLVIVENELSAARSYLEDNFELATEPSEAFRESKYLTRLPSSDGIGHSVILKSALNKGNRSIMNAAHRMAEEDNPDFLVVLGIGGSIHDKHDVGDVLFVTQVNYCEEGKETPEGTRFRIDPWKIKPRLKSQMNHFFSGHGGETLQFKRGDEKFKVKNGIIGSSEKVVADNDSEIRKVLFGIHDKTYQVDMESGGAGSFEYENDLRRNSNLKGLLIVRGASDKADVEKDKTAQHRATKNALHALVKFLELTDSELSFLD